MDQTHSRALEALQPFIHLTTSSSSSSPRFVANIIRNATSNPHTYVFAELLEASAVQALRSVAEYQGYLTLLEIFAWGTWQEYQKTPNLPALNKEQTLKLRMLSLLTLSTTLRPLTYKSLMSALSITTFSDLESLVTTAIYASLITARLSPATNPPIINVTSVAPLRDVRPQTVPTMIAILSEWEGRCGQAIGGIEAEIAKIKAQAAKNRACEQERATRLERLIAGDGDDDGTGIDFKGRLTGGNKYGLRPREGNSTGGRGGGVAKLGPPGTANSNKREYSADDPDEDDGYWDNGSDGGMDAGTLGSRMDIDEGSGAPSRIGAGGGNFRQAKRILNMGKKP
ncbi:COP9 signalosome subunit 7 [Elaphomyces granulatus]